MSISIPSACLGQWHAYGDRNVGLKRARRGKLPSFLFRAAKKTVGWQTSGGGGGKGINALSFEGT